MDKETDDSQDNGWKFLKKTAEGDEVWRKSEESQPIKLIKVCSTLIQNCSNISERGTVHNYSFNYECELFLGFFEISRYPKERL